MWCEVGYYVQDLLTGRWGDVTHVNAENNTVRIEYDDGQLPSSAVVYEDDLIDLDTYDTFERMDKLEEAGIHP